MASDAASPVLKRAASSDPSSPGLPTKKARLTYPDASSPGPNLAPESDGEPTITKMPVRVPKYESDASSTDGYRGPRTLCFMISHLRADRMDANRDPRSRMNRELKADAKFLIEYTESDELPSRDDLHIHLETMVDMPACIERAKEMWCEQRMRSMRTFGDEDEGEEIEEMRLHEGRFLSFATPGDIWIKDGMWDLRVWKHGKIRGRGFAKLKPRVEWRL